MEDLRELDISQPLNNQIDVTKKTSLYLAVSSDDLQEAFMESEIRKRKITNKRKQEEEKQKEEQKEKEKKQKEEQEKQKEEEEKRNEKS